MTPLLAIQDLHVSFRKGKQYITVIDGLNLSIDAGETVALVGESGSGKSMTSLSIMQLIPPPGVITAGDVFFDGINVCALSEKEMNHIRGVRMAMIFQDPMTALNPVLSIGQQMVEGLVNHQQLTKREAAATAIQWLKKVGLERASEIMKEYPHQLSGGMRQRVMIAMAMSSHPQLLIADEPTTALDVTMQAQILDIMKKCQQELGTSILFITHDLGVVYDLADRVMVMYAGQVVEHTRTEDLFHTPLHPYTEGLMGAVPSIDGPIKRLQSIPGSVPAASDMPQGCRFAPRCGKAMERCVHEAPSLREADPGHWVRCFLYNHDQGDEHLLQGKAPRKKEAILREEATHHGIS